LEFSEFHLKGKSFFVVFSTTKKIGMIAGLAPENYYYFKLNIKIYE
jgi:hypothetical protein